MKKLENKTALITGSDSGIGQATAIAFAKEGANVVVCYHTDKEGAEETLQKVKEQGQKGIVVQVDISDEKDVAQLFEKTFKEFGSLDILVNNAAVNGSGTHVADM